MVSKPLTVLVACQYKAVLSDQANLEGHSFKILLLLP